MYDYRRNHIQSTKNRSVCHYVMVPGACLSYFLGNNFVQFIFGVLCGMISDLAFFLRFLVFQCKQNK